MTSHCTPRADEERLRGEPQRPPARRMPQRDPVHSAAFIALPHARFVLAVWQHDYDTARPYSKLGGKTTTKITGERVCGHASDTLPSLQISIIETLTLNGSNQRSTLGGELH